MDVCVSFIIFNRPDLTARVFAEIGRARPSKLMVIADGPRAGKVGESELCAAARAVTERVDWPCEVLRNYSDVNLGCRRRVSSGLDWVFRECEEAIVLEDDCLPHPAFFDYCANLLEFHRDDRSVMSIGGFNPAWSLCNGSEMGVRSRYSMIWGWATWRRAWSLYDVTISQWPVRRPWSWLRGINGTDGATYYWQNALDAVKNEKVDTWDYQWQFALWNHNGDCVLPACNLIMNIGCREDATHTIDAKEPLGGIGYGGTLRAPSHAKTMRYPAVDRQIAEMFFNGNWDSRTAHIHRFRSLLAQGRMVECRMLAFPTILKCGFSEDSLKVAYRAIRGR